MQIKEVCQKTGLTARTIRFYIEEGLIFPNQKRQYNGRRNITFDEDDCTDLNEITLLKQASFSLAEIKELRKDKSKAFEYALRCRQYYESKIEESTKGLIALKDIDHSITYQDFLCRLGSLNTNHDKSKTNIKTYLPKLFYRICLLVCFAFFSYLNLLFIGLSAPTGQFSIYTIIASTILFLSVVACTVSFFKPKSGFIYILFQLMVAAFAAYSAMGEVIIALLLTGIIINIIFYIIYLHTTSLLMNKKIVKE